MTEYLHASEEEVMSYSRVALAAAVKALGAWDASETDPKSTMLVAISAIAAVKRVKEEADKELQTCAKRDGLKHIGMGESFDTQHIVASAMMAKALKCDVANFNPYAEISHWACGFAQACAVLRCASDLHDLKEEGYLGDHVTEYAQKLLDVDY